MFKQFYILRNLKIYNEIKSLLISLSDIVVTDNITVEDIRLRMTDDYKEYLSLPKKWEFIQEDHVLLTALRDELKRLKKEVF